MRYAIGVGIFSEPTAHFFAHNATSALLAQNEHLRNIAVTGTRELSLIVLRLADALKMQQQSGGQTGPAAAFNVAYPEHSNVFEFLGKDAESAGRYHKYMVGRAHTSRWTIGHMIKAYDWGSIGTKTIVDVSRPLLVMFCVSRARGMEERVQEAWVEKGNESSLTGGKSPGWRIVRPHLPSPRSRLSECQIHRAGRRCGSTRAGSPDHGHRVSGTRPTDRIPRTQLIFAADHLRRYLSFPPHLARLVGFGHNTHLEEPGACAQGRSAGAGE